MSKDQIKEALARPAEILGKLKSGRFLIVIAVVIVFIRAAGHVELDTADVTDVIKTVVIFYFLKGTDAGGRTT